MRQAVRAGALLSFLAMGAASGAEPPALSAPPAGRPRIGLVLGGGGAKGAAHIGVLKVLEEMRIPIDCIAGTSMGAIVGAAYSTGMSAAQLEDTMKAVRWRDVLETAPRQEEPFHRKSNDFAFTNGFELGLRDWHIVSPGGLVPTHQIEGMFRQIVAGAPRNADFSQLPIPFRAVATNLETGAMVVFDHGDLAIAMRASMAVPGAFAPVDHDGQLLVDGMLVRNLPVDVARHTCADVVIAVTVANPRASREKLGSFLGVAGQAMNIAIEANEAAQLATLTDRDVAIRVVLQDIGSIDFNRVPEAVPVGEAAARSAATQLARYSLPPDQYAAWRAGVVKMAAAERPRIDEVRVTGTKVTNPEVIRSLIAIQPGEAYDPERADTEADQLVARGDFSAIGYGMAAEDGRNILTFTALEKPWGPNYLLFDVNLSTDFHGDTGWGLRVDHERRWLNALGGELRMSLQLGRPNAAGIEFYQPLDLKQRFFVSPYVVARQTLAYLYEADTRVAQYDARRIGAGFDVGSALGTWGQVRLGIVRQEVDLQNQVGNASIPEPGRHSLGGVLARFGYDTVDQRLFATQGTRATAALYASTPGLGAERRYRTLDLDWGKTIGFKSDFVHLALRGGSNLGSDVPFYDQFRLGGLFNFSGYHPQQLIGQRFAFAGVQYRHRLTFLNETLGTAMYGGASLEAGNVYGRLDGVQSHGALFSGAAFVALDTKIGPLYLGYGYSQGGRSAVYLYLGSSLEGYRP